MIKKIPKYVIIPTILIITMQLLTYYGTQYINKQFTAYYFTIEYIDNLFPVVTFFIVFYILSYPWWYLSPIIVANTDKTRFFNWTVAILLCFIISGFIYAFIPTTITRPVIENNNLFDWLTNYIYLHDSPERPINLFPSYHCLLSWFCFIGVRRQKNIRLWYRYSSLIFAILVCLSTQFIKQHYIVDFISSVILAEVVFYLVSKYNLGNILKNIIAKEE